MSAKIAAVNQTRSEPESTDRDVSVIDVERESMPPPPSYEQAIIVQSELERHRIQEQQRALEELVQEQNRMQRLRIEEQQIQQHPIQQQPIQQQPEAESIAQPTTPIPFPQIVQREYLLFTFRPFIEVSRIYLNFISMLDRCIRFNTPGWSDSNEFNVSIVSCGN